MIRRRLCTAAAVAALTLAAACVSPRNSLGTTTSPCFRAIPVAAAMVHHQGVLIGVRRGGGERFDRRGAVRPARGRGICLVAYHGHYGPTTVDKPVTRATGDYAVAVVSLAGDRPLRTIVTSMPVRFRHL